MRGKLNWIGFEAIGSRREFFNSTTKNIHFWLLLGNSNSIDI